VGARGRRPLWSPPWETRDQSESVAERNGRENERVIERMGKEGGSQNQSS
jgi:hypothetical protein